MNRATLARRAGGLSLCRLDSQRTSAVTCRVERREILGWETKPFQLIADRLAATFEMLLAAHLVTTREAQQRVPPAAVEIFPERLAGEVDPLARRGRPNSG